MKKLRFKRKINKRSIFILVLFFIFLLIGFFYPIFIDKSVITNKLTSYFSDLSNNMYTIDSLILTNLTNNLIENTSISLFAYTIILFPVSVLLYLIKVFIFGLSISSIFITYKVRGVVYLLITIIPSIMHLMVYTITFYYSLSYFIIRVKYRTKITKSRVVGPYFKVILITTILQILISLFDSYLSFYIFKLIK